MAVAGRVAIVPKGEWSVKTAYKRLDAVTVNNTLYIAKKSVPAGIATTNTEYWSKSISGGATNGATGTEDGLMPKEDKKKLNGIDGDVAAKLGESKDGSLTYNGTEIKPSVETGKGLSIGEDGKLQVNIDGTTLTMDEVNNVIKLADTLKDAINGAFPAANVANNQVTTEAGFAHDARQANPNIDGTLAKQISDLNGSLKQVPTKIFSSYWDSGQSFTYQVNKLSLIFVTYGTNQAADFYVCRCVSKNAYALVPIHKTNELGSCYDISLDIDSRSIIVTSKKSWIQVDIIAL